MLILAKLENDDKLTTIDEQTEGSVSCEFLLDVYEPNFRTIGARDGHILNVESFLIMMSIHNGITRHRDIECFRVCHLVWQRTSFGVSNGLHDEITDGNPSGACLSVEAGRQ
jgi:hypothetical protein